LDAFLTPEMMEGSFCCPFFLFFCFSCLSPFVVFFSRFLVFVSCFVVFLSSVPFWSVFVVFTLVYLLLRVFFFFASFSLSSCFCSFLSFVFSRLF